MRASAEQEVCPCSAQPHAADPCNAQGAIRSRCSNSEQARLQKKRKGGYTQQPPASPAAARRTKQQKIATIKQSITRKTVKTGKGKIKEKIWTASCRSRASRATALCGPTSVSLRHGGRGHSTPRSRRPASTELAWSNTKPSVTYWSIADVLVLS